MIGGMDTIREPPRDVPVAADVDVCVVGGGCTGVFAAVAAARLGAKVALVEANGFWGGMATAGLVCVWHSMLDTQGRRTIIGGLTAEVLDRLARRGAAQGPDPSGHHNHVFNSAELQIELDELVRQAGVRAMLHTLFVAAAGADGRVDAALVEDKTGRRAIRARQFIDATGDGDLLVRSGLPCRLLADLQPPTTCAHVVGIDAVARQTEGFDLGAAYFAHCEEMNLPHGFLWSAPCVGLPDARMVAGTRVPDADCSDADALTAAEMEGRRQVRALVDVLCRLPGGTQVSLAALPARIGVRETRHAVCLHRLTEREVLDGVRFDDAIANGSYRVDVHHSGKPGLTFRYLDGREDYVVPGRPTVRRRWRPQAADDPTFYQIPYRCLVPRGGRNVLTAGRLIDADRGAYGAIRVMVNCNQTGEAAGLAACLANEAGVDVADVDAGRLRCLLAAQGAVVI